MWSLPLKLGRGVGSKEGGVSKGFEQGTLACARFLRLIHCRVSSIPSD